VTARDPVDSLLAAFASILGPLTDATRQSEQWASATFYGARHTIAFTASATADIPNFAASIAEADIPVRGGFVADVAIVSCDDLGDRHRIVVEVLTIDAA
jgi:hypothetical protein